MLIELGCDRDEAAGHAGKDTHWGGGQWDTGWAD